MGWAHGHAPIVTTEFCRCSGGWPHWHHNLVLPAAGLFCAGDLAHGVVEGQAEDLDVEVNGVAGQISFGPAPVASRP